MLLVLDIGNTDITLGIFDNETLLETFRIPSDKKLDIPEYEDLIKFLCKKHRIRNCIIGSVVEELTHKLKDACDNVFNTKTMIVTPEFNHGLVLDLENPEKLGADRIANAVFAKKYCKLPAIVVDIGSATTFDIVNKDGIFIGGVIMAGLKLQMKSLFENTSKLPQIEIENSEKAIGNDTKSAILSGVIRGAACAIEGLIRQCEFELGEKATIVATGGYSEFLSKYMNRKFDDIKPELTLHGLRLIYQNNFM